MAVKKYKPTSAGRRQMATSSCQTSSATRLGANTRAGRWSGVRAWSTVAVLPSPMSMNSPAPG